MNNFNYKNKCEIVFGDRDERELACLLKNYEATHVFICYGGGSVVKSGLLDKITHALKNEGIKFTLFGGIVANPLKSRAIQGVREIKKCGADFIMALGGGSVIDTAKFIALSFGDNDVDDIWEIYKQGARNKIVSALPICAVLTIPAAGSECSTATVIRDDESNTKFSVGSELLRPRFAYINPRYCTTLPRKQIANGASDILAHLLERYFSPQTNVTLTDNLITGAIQAMLKIAPQVYAEPDNYNFWAEFCLLGTLAHNNMLDMGRDVQDWGTHRIENKLLSGHYNIAHGTGLAILFPAWMKFVARTKPEKVLQFAREVMGVNEKDENQQQIIDRGISKLTNFYKSLNMATTISELGINHKEVIALVDKYFAPNDCLGGYGNLNREDIKQIIEIAK